MSFKDWLVKKYRLKSGRWRDSRFGDLAEDAFNDKQFPTVLNSQEEVRGYLSTRGACREAINTASTAYQKYEKERQAK